MAKKNKPLASERTMLFLAILLTLAVPFTVYSALQQTFWANHASGGLPIETEANLNSTTDMLESINSDGTMGPKTFEGNWSNAIPAYLKGSLVFTVIDPPGGKPNREDGSGNRPTESFHEKPTHSLPPQAQGNVGTAPSQLHGPQEITALTLTITKVEVHMAYFGNPKDNKNTDEEGTSSASSSKNENADHWETLAVNNPFVVDLVALAKSGDASILGITSLAAGRYTEVRLYVSDASATLADGTSVILEIPGKNNVVRVVRPFTIVSGQSTKLTMDINAQRSVIKAGDKYLLKPVVARFLQDHQLPEK